MESLLEYSGHVAYGLILASFLVRNILWLRGLSIVASLTSIIFNYNVPAVPLWTPIQWNCLFIATNIVQIVMIFLDKRQIDFDGWKQYLYENVFTPFTPGEFNRLTTFGFSRKEHTGTVLINEGEKPENIFVLISGTVSIKVSGSEVATLGPGSFFGEMSYITQEAARADVIANEPIQYFFWDVKQLKEYLSKNPNCLVNFQGLLGRQVIQELMALSTKDSQELKQAA